MTAEGALAIGGNGGREKRSEGTLAERTLADRALAKGGTVERRSGGR